MNLLLRSCVLLVLCFELRPCVENNVCRTFKDYYSIKSNANCWYDFTVDSDVVEIIKKHGYPVETHKSTTTDGYILTSFRIPSPLTWKKPVLLQHGWLDNAISFIAKGNNSLAFLLADAGFDVWLGNFRGTQYSEQHVNLTVYDQQFWNYSADEIGMYDVPALLETIANVTGEKGNTVIIGHSLGSTAALIYNSVFPKQAKKTIKLLILLAPAAVLSHTKANLFKMFGPFFEILLKIITSNGLMRVVSQADTLKKIVRLICLESPFLMERCIQLQSLLTGGPGAQIEPSMAPIIYSHFPAGCSFKVAKHIADFTMGNFRRYDYGPDNVKKYGTVFPPKYHISKVKVPTFIMYANTDWFCTKKDTVVLYSQLPAKSQHGTYEITSNNFNHFDFLLGKDVKTLVNKPIISVLRNLNYATITKKKF